MRRLKNMPGTAREGSRVVSSLPSLVYYDTLTHLYDHGTSNEEQRAARKDRRVTLAFVLRAPRRDLHRRTFPVWCLRSRHLPS